MEWDDFGVSSGGSIQYAIRKRDENLFELQDYGFYETLDQAKAAAQSLEDDITK